ncbi:hypothetical protein GCM10027615_28310 [Plantactinospora veratri]
MGRSTRNWVMIIALVVATPLGAAACGGDGDEKPQFVSGNGGAAGATPSPTPPAEPLEFAITPASGAKKQPVSVEIGTSVKGGKISNVSLTLAGGEAVRGAMRPDGTSWCRRRH